MEKLNANAQRARDVAARKHKEELDNLHVEIEHLASLARDNKREELAETRRADKFAMTSIILAIALFVCIVLCITNWFDAEKSRIDQPPALVKVHASVEAYMDAKGVYRSYSNGEPLDPQPKEWKMP